MVSGNQSNFIRLNMEITSECLTISLPYRIIVNTYSTQRVICIAITIRELRRLITKHVDKYLINKYNNNNMEVDDYEGHPKT
jgi:hypothetical protein